HADLGAVAVRTDAVQVLLERTARHARGSVEEVRQVRAGARLHRTLAEAAAVGGRLDERGGRRAGVDRGDDRLGRRGGGAGPVGGEGGRDQVAGGGGAERLVGRARVQELGLDVVAALLAPVLGGEDDGAGGAALDRLHLEREVAEVAREARDLERVGAADGQL